jgi:hypothetical protein
MSERKRQTARKSTGTAVWKQRQALARPPTFKERLDKGGETGLRTAEERIFLVTDLFHHHALGVPLPRPSWFTERFFIYPAYLLNPWEEAVVYGQAYPTVLCKFYAVCGEKDFQEILIEQRVFSEVQQFVLNHFSKELALDPVSIDRKESVGWALSLRR